MMYICIAFVIIITLWCVWGFFSSRVEQLSYTVLKKTKDYEIREYSSHLVAQTTVTGSYTKSINTGFTILARYIFGGNTKKESIAMTTPVITQKEKSPDSGETVAMTAPVMATVEDNSHTISFSMPRSHTRETLPTPQDSRVQIVVIPTKKYAVLRFSWYRSDVRIKRMQKKLLSMLTRDGVAHKRIPVYAGYNAPFTPPWMIRNEVMVELVKTATKKIVLAGGCFWGMEELIRKQPGVVDTIVGYTGGTIKNPTYNNHEGHAEAVEILYDPHKTSYKKMLDFFFQIHNPTTLNQQGNDVGTSYRSAIFYGNDEEKREAQNFIEIVNNSKRWNGPVVTTLEPLQKFYPAEDYHQDYLQKNPAGYTCHTIYFDSYLT